MVKRKRKALRNSPKDLMIFLLISTRTMLTLMDQKTQKLKPRLRLKKGRFWPKDREIGFLIYNLMVISPGELKTKSHNG